MNIGRHRWRIDPCRFRWPWVTLKDGMGGVILRNIGSFLPHRDSSATSTSLSQFEVVYQAPRTCDETNSRNCTTAGAWLLSW